MNQPKTTEEFMALPVRDRFKTIEQTQDNGVRYRRRVASIGYTICYESDTIFCAGGYLLGRDENGYHRYPGGL
jgi:hypothetical protein